MKLTDEQRAELLQVLTIEPCHTTGMHDPNHTIEYVCDGQRREILKRLLEWLGVTEQDLPHALHDNCYWCHDVSSQEEYRIKKRMLHKWAGRTVSEELAAPADDAEEFYERMQEISHKEHCACPVCWEKRAKALFP